MRSMMMTIVLGVCLESASVALAQEDPRAIIDKGIQALGGEEKLSQLRAGQSKSKGTVRLGNDIAFTQDMTFQLPERFKETLNMEVNGMRILITTVFDGDKGWINQNGQTRELDDRLLREIREVANLLRIGRLIYLKDKRYVLAGLQESQVNGRSAAGVKVSAKGYRDVSLYFDKQTGLLAKIERPAINPVTGQEVAEERLLSDYQEVQGIKMPKKVLVNRDGRKFMEAEVVEVKLLDKVAEKVFEKP